MNIRSEVRNGGNGNNVVIIFVLVGKGEEENKAGSAGNEECWPRLADPVLIVRFRHGEENPWKMER